MGSISVELDDELAALLREHDRRPIAESVRELVVMDLYRRAEISRSRAARLLGLSLLDFLLRASALGTPFVSYTDEEWAAEMQAVDEFGRSLRSSSTPAP